MINAILCTASFLALIWLGRRLERIHEEEKRDLEKLHEARIDAIRDLHDAALERERACSTRCLNWQERAKFLWNLLDDIDTLDDECRNNHVKFRARVRAAQQRRKEVAESDGYVLTWKETP